MATAELVKELRDRTGAGMMDCKAALQASNNDMEQAVDFLRKKGMAQASKRAGREAKEGLIYIQVQADKALMLEANCETDFVARTDDFTNLAKLAASEVWAKGEQGLEAPNVTSRLAELSGKIGEKMLIRRAKLAKPAAGGRFFSYLHSNQKLGVLVELTSKNNSYDKPEFQELGKNLAMQIAAGNPLCIQRTEVPAASLEREKAIYREEVKGKPENVVEKIIQGKLEKFYQTNCLIEQPFIKDDKTSIKKLIEDISKKLSDTITVPQFVRFQLGESADSSQQKG